MLRSFQTFAPDRTLAQVNEVLAREDEYCVVVGENGEPLSLATGWQLRQMPDQEKTLSQFLNVLPKVIAVEQDTTMDQLLDDLAAALFGTPDVSGVAVLQNGSVSGVLPRQAIKEYARLRIRTAMGGGTIEGNPLTNARTYACPNGDHEQVVPFYNRFDPPKCPTHKILLVRKD